MSTQYAYKYYSEIMDEGRVVIPELPIPKGTPVEVIILLHKRDDISDLLKSSESSLDFWNNPIDDKVWNNV
ncbi:MAG: DUF2281 domain-containing protein [Candidatus Desantisbacteria bacterium]